MLVVMRPGATLKEITHVITTLEDRGVMPVVNKDGDRTRIGITSKNPFSVAQLATLAGVEDVVDEKLPFKRVSREFHPQSTVIRIGDVTIGDGGFTLFAGPCAIESEAQIHEIARFVKTQGARGLRGGAFKPRSSPYSFQGLGEQGLKFMHDAARENGLIGVSEVMDVRQVPLLARYADMIQIGARNMQNFDLLREVGLAGKPVMLKRGLSATIEELLLAAEYVCNSGAPQIVLCERGIRTFETSTRNTLDISAVPLCKGLSHLPVIVDPSHAAGRRDLIKPLSLAAVAVGADGAIIETHPLPDKAASDGPQSLTFKQFADCARAIGGLVAAIRG